MEHNRWRRKTKKTKFHQAFTSQIYSLRPLNHLNYHFQRFRSPAANSEEQSHLLLPLSSTTAGNRRFEYDGASTGNNDGAGELVAVRGGHLVGSTCQKDRHSKVWTAKGPRDRRVRLSAQTAIQFYDVQDRLGYDRPSKVVDWLIKKAKFAIDELSELPAWGPYTFTNPKTQTRAMQNHVDENSETPIRINNKKRASAFTVTAISPVQFQSYSDDFATGNGQNSEDLKISLQSLHRHENDHVLSSEAVPTIGGSNEWPELNQFQRMYSWNCGETDTGNGNELFFSSSPPLTMTPSPVTWQPFSGESQFFLQRGPLQSNNTPFLRAIPADTSPFDYPIPAYLHQVSVPSLGFSSNGISEPSASSFDSRH